MLGHRNREPPTLSPPRAVRVATLTLAVLLGAAPAAATTYRTGEHRLTERDLARLETFERLRSAALAGARAGGEAADLEALEAVLGPARGVPGDLELVGRYRCRSMQMDEGLPLVVYGWFKCAIDNQYAGPHLVKTTGSQMFDGHLGTTDEDWRVFWGTASVSGDEPVAYGRDPERDRVGRFIRIGDGHYRLEFPAPIGGTRFEIVEIEKTR